MPPPLPPIDDDEDSDSSHGSAITNAANPPVTRKLAPELERGRTRTIAIEVPAYQPSEHSPSPPAKRQRTSSLSRDSHGRFAPKTPGEGSSSAIKPKGPRSSSLSVRSVNASSQARDSHGRFSSKNGSGSPSRVRSSKKVSAPKTYSTATAFRRASATGIPVLVRNSKGRFAPKAESSSPPLQQLIVPAQQPIPTLEPQAQMSTAQPDIQVAEKKKKKRQPAKSPFFATPPKPQRVSSSQGQPGTQTTPSSSQRQQKSPGKNVSCIPFPPLSAPHFGLIQEKLAHDPFRLLIAVTFLIRTHGKHAIPVFFELMERYPTPESLVAAEKDDIVDIIRHLGLQNQRAETYRSYAQIWLDDPPTKGKRYPVRGYPDPDSARGLKLGEAIDDEDERHAWEIGHMTNGPYALDSWRIFCRDKLRGVAEGWNGEGTEAGFQPEWMRVVPEDKELRAYLRWMWLKEGFEWDPFTGDKEVASPRLMRAAMEGRIAWDDEGGMRILE